MAFNKAIRLGELQKSIKSARSKNARALFKREANTLNQWFTPGKKKKALEWQRKVISVAFGALRRINPSPGQVVTLNAILKTSELQGFLETHKISDKRLREVLSAAGFGRQRPGRPKK